MCNDFQFLSVNLWQEKRHLLQYWCKLLYPIDVRECRVLQHGIQLFGVVLLLVNEHYTQMFQVSLYNIIMRWIYVSIIALAFQVKVHTTGPSTHQCCCWVPL